MTTIYLDTKGNHFLSPPPSSVLRPPSSTVIIAYAVTNNLYPKPHPRIHALSKHFLNKNFRVIKVPYTAVAKFNFGTAHRKPACSEHKNTTHSRIKFFTDYYLAAETAIKNYPDSFLSLPPFTKFMPYHFASLCKSTKRNEKQYTDRLANDTAFFLNNFIKL